MQELEAFVRETSSLVVLTGAGCSTGSGIPDYRDENGEWKRNEPVRFQAFVGNDTVRKRYWARSMVGWQLVDEARPNAAHRALALLEASGRVDYVITQNVDGLHQAAGSRAVNDLHGRVDRVRCLDCRGSSRRASFQTRLFAMNPEFAGYDASFAPDGDADLEGVDFDRFRVPACDACGGMLKPDVVFFGESVPRARVDDAMSAVDRSDGLLIVGSSLMVWSGYRFARRAAEREIPIASVNLGKTRADAELMLQVRQDCGPVLSELARRLSAV